MTDLDIALSHVSLTLGEHPVLSEVSFGVARGETKVILGGSGCGKTTILRLILGLYRPGKGSILIEGRNIAELHEKDLTAVRQNMAMVFQSAALFDSLTVGENVGYRLWEHSGLPEQTIEQRVRESLAFVGLDDTIDKMPAELSGGMRKRVGIARAIATGARILLYDEPTAGLDPINTCMISRLIRSLKEKGVTQVVVTHDLETAYQVADRIVMVHKGQVIFEGPVEELKEDRHAAIQAFLDPGAYLSTHHASPAIRALSE